MTKHTVEAEKAPEPDLEALAQQLVRLDVDLSVADIEAKQAHAKAMDLARRFHAASDTFRDRHTESACYIVGNMVVSVSRNGEGLQVKLVSAVVVQ